MQRPCGTSELGGSGKQQTDHQGCNQGRRGSPLRVLIFCPHMYLETSSFLVAEATNTLTGEHESSPTPPPYNTPVVSTANWDELKAEGPRVLRGRAKAQGVPAGDAPPPRLLGKR